MRNKSRATWGDGRIAVIAKWDKISSALTAGYPMSRIYRDHISPDVISYSQFVRHVAKRLKAGQSPQQEVEQTHVSNHGIRTPGLGGFDFKPPSGEADRARLIGPSARKK